MELLTSGKKKDNGRFGRNFEIVENGVRFLCKMHFSFVKRRRCDFDYVYETVRYYSSFSFFYILYFKFMIVFRF